MQMSTHPGQTKEGSVFPPQTQNREFDLWLQRELGRLHGEVLHEAVPDKLLRILEDASRSQDCSVG